MHRSLRKSLPLFTLFAALVFLGACQADGLLTDEPGDLDLSDPLNDAKAVIETGNGALNGPHYNLNIIGVPNDKTADMDGNNGHRIFVKLSGNTKIYLTEGDDFAVLDANGTDGDGAEFQLPNPDPDNDGTTEYSVFARALGKPGGTAEMTTCGLDEYDEEYCSTLTTIEIERKNGRSSFENVSRDLLYVYADLTDDDTYNPKRYPLFDEALEDYYWSYDNNGLKLYQLRFYEVPTTIEDPVY